jgi:hypothetical protein
MHTFLCSDQAVIIAHGNTIKNADSIMAWQPTCYIMAATAEPTSTVQIVFVTC